MTNYKKDEEKRNEKEWATTDSARKKKVNPSSQYDPSLKYDDPTMKDLGDPVHHPPHYTFGKIEVLNAIEDWGLDYHRGNVVKYMVRAGKKNPDKMIEDLRKARFYIDRLIKLKQENIDGIDFH